jgi:hypothetical protein
MSYLVLYAALTAAGVLGTAAVLKLRRHHDFASSMVALGVVRPRLSGPAATVVIAAETLTTIACLTPPYRAYGLAAAVVLLSAFAVVAERAARRPPVPCRCFGSGTVPLGRRHVARNLVLVALFLAALAAALTAPASAAWPSASLCMLGAVVTTALVVRADDLVDLIADLAPNRPE